METFAERNWDAEVLRSAVPVVACFCAEWCVPCRLATPALETAEGSHRGRFRFGLVNYDDNAALAERYEIQGLPTLLVVKDGRPVARRVGLMGRVALKTLLERVR